MQITQRQLGHVEFVYAAEMATRALWNSGHFLPSPRQENLPQDGVSSLNPTFLTSFSPSLRDVMRRIIKATQNFRRAKKSKNTDRYGWKGITRNLTSDFLYKAELPSAPGQVDEGFIQPCFESSHRRKFHCLSWHHAPLLHHPQGKLFCLCV